MKIVIDISKNEYNDIIEQVKKCDYPDMGLGKIIANGTPVSTEGDLISREALKEATKSFTDCDGFNPIWDIIDNAPTVPLPDFKEGYKQAILDGKTNYSSKQGEWIDYDNTFYKCPDCGYLLEKCCPQCQNKVILPKGGRE